MRYQLTMIVPENLIKFVSVKEFAFGDFKVVTYAVRPLRGRGPDDETYAKYPELIKMVPRGFSELYYKGELVTTIRGLDKFDGTSRIDEDEDVGDSSPIFDSKTVDEWSQQGVLEVNFTEKANGKFAIFTLFKMEDQVWMFGGSKNRHVPVPFNQPITGKDLHDVILRAIQAELNKLPASEVSSLIGKTVVGEYVDGKHIVHTDRPYLVFFNVHGTSLPTVKNLYPTVRGLPSTEQLLAVRNLKNIEGVVIEYKNAKTGDLIRQKHKTNWYIIWRCWREILCRLNKSTVSKSDCVSRLQSRLMERSAQFLSLSDSALSEFKKLASDFVDWLYASHYSLSDCSFTSSIGMANIIHSFVASTNPGQVVLKCIDDPLESMVDPDVFDSAVKLAKFGLNVVVVMSGPSGTGKSTLTAHLIKTLDGHSVEKFSTDDLFMVDGEYKFDPTRLRENHQRNFEAFKASTAQVRIVDNTNIAKWEYEKYFTAAGDAVCLIFYMKPRTAEELAKRSSHGLTETMISAKLKDYKPQPPAYYGLFVKPADVKKLTAGLSYTQVKAPHVTLVYVGGRHENDVRPSCFNKVVDVNVIGHSITAAGHCLVVQSNPTAPLRHITLSTNDGYKPVDVGINMQVEKWPQATVLQAVCAPYY